MSHKRSAISISKLARYASDPNSVVEKVDIAATKYGTKAHAAIGKGPSLITYICIGVAIFIAAKLAGLI
ncbi:hypothetical protein GC387_22165 [Pseudomonas sp. MWU12-2323]|nr:hypothetical protein [Pseudomonas sp. MWU12-2323]